MTEQVDIRKALESKSKHYLEDCIINGSNAGEARAILQRREEKAKAEATAGVN